MKWLFLVHHIQTPNSRERVKVWRLTKKVGAVLYRNSVYVLPYSKERLEDFHWLCQQIRDSQGEASVFVSESTDLAENQTLLVLFNKTRESEYDTLMQAAEKVVIRIRRSRNEKRFSQEMLKGFSKEISDLEATFLEIEKNDFFSLPLKKKVRTMIERTRKELEVSGTVSAAPSQLKYHDRKMFHAKTWMTRENIHIDRLCSAWLVRKFIDPKAKFVFAPETYLPKNAIPFDIFGVEFSHHGEDCTFETLLKAFRIKDKALASIAQIVHDIDMKDNKFGRPEANGVDAVVRSLSDSLRDDQKVLEIGSSILNALYAQFTSAR